MTVIIPPKKIRPDGTFLNDLNQYRATYLICICLNITQLYFLINKWRTKIVISTIEVIIIGKLLSKSKRFRLVYANILD